MPIPLLQVETWAAAGLSTAVGDEPVDEAAFICGEPGDAVWTTKPNLWTKHNGVTTTSRGATVERRSMFRKSAAPACRDVSRITRRRTPRISACAAPGRGRAPPRRAGSVAADRRSRPADRAAGPAATRS